MADQFFSGLTAASVLSASDLFGVQQGGSELLKLTGTQLKAFVGGAALVRVSNQTSGYPNYTGGFSLSSNAGVWTQITFTTVVEDAASCWNSGGSYYTCPSAGIYLVRVCCTDIAVVTNTASGIIDLWINTTLTGDFGYNVKGITDPGGYNVGSTNVFMITCAAGDTIKAGINIYGSAFRAGFEMSICRL
jgi:hypothetical protein